MTGSCTSNVVLLVLDWFCLALPETSASDVLRTVNDPLDQELERQLTRTLDAGLMRSLRRVDSPQGREVRVSHQTLLNFSSNDYLGLSNHPALKQAACQATERYGTGTGASRLVCGSLTPHHELEEQLAAFNNTPAALVFSSGYATAVGTLSALLGPSDVVIIDKLAHACIVDAARLSRAKLRVFRHNDLDHLESILNWADQRQAASMEPDRKRRSRTLVITESVFSMDGDLAPLRELVALKNRYGAWLMIDEAHAIGVLGESRTGLVNEYNLGDQLEIRMGTLGKAIGAAGGYVCGSRLLVDSLVNAARSFIFSTAPPPATMAAASAGIQLIQSEEGRNRHRTLWNQVNAARAGLSALGLISDRATSHILPISIGDESRAMAISESLQRDGILLPAIRYPTVARRQARLRLTLSASHYATDIETLIRALSKVTSGPTNFQLHP